MLDPIEKNERCVRMMLRLHQVILIFSGIFGSWLGMQAVHEAGHVLAAWWTGGQVARVVLHPLTISRTDLTHNPNPLLVVWSGPVLGCLIPLGIWLAARSRLLSAAFLLRFFAGFCFIANGAYIGAGSFDRVGDSGEMLRHGSPIWTLWLFGAITVSIGLALWHGLGPSFGLGPSRGHVNAKVAYGALGFFVLLVAVGLIVDGE